MALTRAQRMQMTPQQIAKARRTPKLECKALTTMIVDPEKEDGDQTELKEGELTNLDSGVARTLAKRGIVEVIEPEGKEKLKPTGKRVNAKATGSGPMEDPEAKK